MKRDSKYWARAAVIAAVYAAVTLLFAPLSYGIMQVRPAEALIVLCVYMECAVPGITLGCLLANILGPNGMADIVFGTLASLAGAWGTYMLRRRKYLAPTANVAANGLIVGPMLYCVLGLDFSLIACILWVAAGEFIACVMLGIPIIKIIDSRKDLKL